MDDLSYLAGLVDGEGCVGHFSKGVGKRKRFQIEIKMTSEFIIDWLVATYGGSKTYRPSGNPKWKDQWRWKVQDKGAVALYDCLRPLLKLKIV